MYVCYFFPTRLCMCNQWLCYFSLTHRSLNMLAAIEGCLEKLFETIESLPREKVEAAEKVTPRILWALN